MLAKACRGSGLRAGGLALRRFKFRAKGCGSRIRGAWGFRV